MKKKSLPYRQGDWFVVPVCRRRADRTKETLGYALGLATYVDGKGILIGYFFGPCRDTPPTLEDAVGKRPVDAVLIRQAGDLALLEGRWKVLGRLDGWTEADWPIPIFAGRSAWPDQKVLVLYSKTNLAEVVWTEPCSPEDAVAFPEDGLSGAGALEIRLGKLLG